MTREITHMRMFTIALESMGKPPFVIGKIAPTQKLVDQIFNDSTGEGDHGEIDTRGPWNEGEPWQFVESPAIQAMRNSDNGTETTPIHAESSELGENEAIQELLIEELRDILHAEKQLLKALPKMAKAARSSQLQRCFEQHLQETEQQAARLEECLTILGSKARAKPCKGMMGIIEEGEEVLEESKKKDDAAADLALISAAQRVEHYEISGYTTARNLAQQLKHSAIVQQLNASLGEEENADQLLNQIARPLMSAARMPAAVD
jgi:Mn-containing catalase